MFSLADMIQFLPSLLRGALLTITVSLTAFALAMVLGLAVGIARISRLWPLRTVTAICSIEAEVSSRLAACSSVRCERSVVLVEISAAAFDTSRPTSLISETIPVRRSAILLASSLSVAKRPR